MTTSDTPTWLCWTAWQAAPSSRTLLVKGDGSKEIVVEGLQDQRLLYSVSRDVGKTWETPSGIQLSDSRSSELRGPVWSPVLHAAEDGRLWLFYSQSRECKKTVNGQVTWAPGGDIKAVTLKNVKSLSTAIFDSSDSPIWSMPKTIISQDDDNGLPKVVANKMIVLTSGEWVLPFWREKPDSESYVCMGNVMNLPSAGVLISTDDGNNWSVHGELRDVRSPLIEGSVVQLESGSILMLLRSASGCAWRSVSHDRGRSWTPAVPTHVPNPNSKAHVIRLKKSGHLVMAYNNHKPRGSHLPTEDGQDNQCRSCRTALELAISADDGVTWRKLALVENEFTPGIRIHYPTLQQVDDMLMVIYSKFYLYREPGEWSQEQGIKLATFNISGLLSTSANVVLRGVPSQRLLINVVSHFIDSLSPEDISRIQMHGHTHRLATVKRFEKRWRLLSTILCSRYDFSHLGGQRWLFSKLNFGRYAVGRVWSLPTGLDDISKAAGAAVGAPSLGTLSESPYMDDVVVRRMITHAGASAALRYVMGAEEMLACQASPDLRDTEADVSVGVNSSMTHLYMHGRSISDGVRPLTSMDIEARRRVYWRDIACHIPSPFQPCKDTSNLSQIFFGTKYEEPKH
eukprot:CAMPEP_0177752494 /NCGR_PEP_ID=MMETSP0491_2-20121128/950_1 /TAXON_ID=63592 /ORGANISM="Tetraselmis chuii, Strain PLY429" /LENGTH=625 /DNA_ID=CAMNT_0019267703 /DNA_START=61 /DNA_END=1937 /DNA_ORIENTATION=+